MKQKIAICIATRNRPDGLARLLKSLDMLEVGSDQEVEIIVVENDQVNRSEGIVTDFRTCSRFPIRYFLEPLPGLVRARNRSIKEAGNCDFCCFTDDDETVANSWLAELTRCQREFNADGVAGPTFPVFPIDVSPSISKFHQPKIYPYGKLLTAAYTGCLLLRKSKLDELNGPFDLRLNFTGGEDIYLTYLITSRGGNIRFNPEAKAYEYLPLTRSSIKYLWQRAYRNANTGLFVNYLKFGNKVVLKTIPRLLWRLGYGLILFLPLYLRGGEKKLNGLIKIAHGLGGLHYVLGRKNIFYK